MTLLTVVQDALDQVGFARPGAVASSNDQTVRRAHGLLNNVGKKLMRDYDWQVLRKEANFTTQAQAEQVTIAGQWPDFDRFVNDTFHNRTQQRKVWGPLSPQSWQWNRSEVAQVQYDTLYVREGKIHITPNPAAGEAIYFEYVSKNWVTGKDAATADADTFVLDEYLLSLGLIANFKRSHGFEYAEEMKDFEREVERRQGIDGAKPRINMASTRAYDLIDANVPDGSWS